MTPLNDILIKCDAKSYPPKESEYYFVILDDGSYADIEYDFMLKEWYVPSDDIVVVSWYRPAESIEEIKKMLGLFDKEDERITIEKANIAAITIADSLNPKLKDTELPFFIAGFQECIKWIKTL